MQTFQADSRVSEGLRQDSPGVGVRTPRGAKEEGSLQNLTHMAGSSVSPHAASPPLQHKAMVTPGQGTEWNNIP